MGQGAIIGIAVALAVLLALAIVAGGVVRWASRLQRQGAAEARRVLGENAVVLLEDLARFLGTASAGTVPSGGWGCLAASRDEIVFVRWKPRQTMRISRSKIRGVESPPLPAARGREIRLLAIRFEGDAGQGDSAAWQVRDPGAWTRELGAAERR